jgi:hypothetical protein
MHEGRAALPWQFVPHSEVEVEGQKSLREEMASYLSVKRLYIPLRQAPACMPGGFFRLRFSLFLFYLERHGRGPWVHCLSVICGTHPPIILLIHLTPSSWVRTHPLLSYVGRPSAGKLRTLLVDTSSTRAYPDQSNRHGQLPALFFEISAFRSPM